MEASATARNRSRLRVAASIMNCIGNHPSLFLQRVYSETSPQNCGRHRVQPGPLAPSLLPRVITHCHLHCLPPVRSESAIGRNMQCERGNFKVVSAAPLNTFFRIDTWGPSWW
jgi:hypothetical protein